MMTIFGPLLEEGLFRWLPDAVTSSIASGRQGGGNWLVGIPANVAFALAHNFVGEDEQHPDQKESRKGSESKDETQFSMKYIPAPQLILGLTFWNIMRFEGYYYSFFAHALNNTEVFGVMTALSNASPRTDPTKRGKHKITRRELFRGRAEVRAANGPSR